MKKIALTVLLLAIAATSFAMSVEKNYKENDGYCVTFSDDDLETKIKMIKLVHHPLFLNDTPTEIAVFTYRRCMKLERGD